LGGFWGSGDTGVKTEVDWGVGSRSLQIFNGLYFHISHTLWSWVTTYLQIQRSLYCTPGHVVYCFKSFLCLFMNNVHIWLQDIIMESPVLLTLVSTVVLLYITFLVYLVYLAYGRSCTAMQRLQDSQAMPLLTDEKKQLIPNVSESMLSKNASWFIFTSMWNTVLLHSQSHTNFSYRLTIL
jgi:hypothetical protein